MCREKSSPKRVFLNYHSCSDFGKMQSTVLILVTKCMDVSPKLRFSTLFEIHFLFIKTFCIESTPSYKLSLDVDDTLEIPIYCSIDAKEIKNGKSSSKLSFDATAF